MMGQHHRTEPLFCYFRPEDQVPEHHLLRKRRTLPKPGEACGTGRGRQNDCVERGRGVCLPSVAI